MSIKNRKIIGGNITRIRKEKGKTQIQICGTIDVTGQQLSRYERGENPIDADALFSLAKRLKVDVSEMFTGCR